MRGNGTATNFTYDAISRLSSMTQDLVGTVQDLTVNAISYNPASQLACLTRSNDSFAYTGHYNVNRAYGTNGLNQLISAGQSAGDTAACGGDAVRPSGSQNDRRI